jgi:hypothetical protein
MLTSRDLLVFVTPNVLAKYWKILRSATCPSAALANIRWIDPSRTSPTA